MTKSWLLLAVIVANSFCQAKSDILCINIDKRGKDLVKVCCEGYVGTPPKCLPHCKRRCQKNAHCIAPEICECNKGYHRKSRKSGGFKCVPHCVMPCGKHSYCAAPDDCVCRKGYQRNLPEQQCEPICEPQCVNALCTAPQECTCNEGYETMGGRKYSLQGCQPQCSNCTYGDCLAPEHCRCWPGFFRDAGCRALPDAVQSVEYCLNNCNCLHEITHWAVERSVAACLQICNRGLQEPCVELSTCRCITANNIFICESEPTEPPRRYACLEFKPSPKISADMTESSSTSATSSTTSLATTTPSNVSEGRTNSSASHTALHTLNLCAISFILIRL